MSNNGFSCISAIGCQSVPARAMELPSLNALLSLAVRVLRFPLMPLLSRKWGKIG